MKQIFSIFYLLFAICYQFRSWSVLLCLLLLSSLSFSQYKGGSYDGFDNKEVSCAVLTTNIFLGGSYDGFATINVSCAVLTANIFLGGSYDGFSADSVRCVTPPPPSGTVPFIGGKYNGIALQEISCPALTTNIFLGGSYNGIALQEATCPVLTTNIFTGGSYNGVALQETSCPVLTANVFVGGSYNGIALQETSCPVLTANIFIGGSYNGIALQETSCPVLTANIFIGGSYNGVALQEASCPVLTANIFIGGSYNGISTDSTRCVTPPPPSGTVPFIGGAYDGIAMISISCPVLTTNIFVGGSYDGFDTSYTSCSTLPQQVFSFGGSYDGFDTTISVPCPSLSQPVFSYGGSYDGFGFSGIACWDEPPLPIELLSFYGKRKDNTIILEWITASESNTSHFVVERLNTNKAFEFIATISAAGNSSQLLSYNSIDKNPYIGFNYYRLSTVDIDGTLSYSNIIAIFFDPYTEDKNYSITFYPNPTNDFLNLHFSGLPKETTLVEIYDLIGRRFFSKNFFITASEEEVKIEVTFLPVGIYLIVVQGKNQRYNLKNKMVKM
ncbi:MAG: NosD domain-containing protein [Bacteroidota bacterium]